MNADMRPHRGHGFAGWAKKRLHGRADGRGSNSASWRAAQWRQPVARRRQAQRLARPRNTCNQTQEGDRQRSENHRRHEPMGEKRDNATVVVRISCRVIMRGAHVRALCRISAVTVCPLMCRRADGQYGKHQHKRRAQGRHEAGGARRRAVEVVHAQRKTERLWQIGQGAAGRRWIWPQV